LRIVIDLQAAQSPYSRNRGIGRYSIALAKAMLRCRGDHEILIALNGMYADTVAPVREAFAGLLPPTDIVTWHATMPPLEASHPSQRRASELVREAFLAGLKPDIVHVASLFESGPYSYTSIGLGTGTHRTAVTLYDLIPHVYPDIYLHRPEAAREYGEKIDNLCRADLWLAISEASRREGIDRLSLPSEQVVNISSAADEHFTPGRLPARGEAALRRHYGLWRPFAMYTGGIDHRKNIEGLIAAWAALPQPVRHAHQLAIVCSVQPADRARLEKLAADLGLAPGEMVLTGFVPEEHLVDLYRLCKLFIFPSMHEGFGLPALEAMSCGTAVIGANNSSIPEVIGTEDALFDAHSQASMTARIAEYLQDDARRAQLAAHGLEQARRFSWDASARRAMSAFEALAPRPAAPRPAAKPRLAYVSPMPPQRSGIADYSAELLPALAAHYDIDLVVEQPELNALPANSFLQQRSAAWFLEHGDEYDRVLYQFGNSAFHEYMLALLERHPGTVVLHDFFLSGLQAHRELVMGKGPKWAMALFESHGWHALERRAKASDMTPVIHEFPANFDVLREAQGIIVHSPVSKALAEEWYGPGAADDWALIPLLRVAMPLNREQARAELGLGEKDFLVCAFGLMGPTKMNDRLLRAWQQSALAKDANCRLVFVGENHPGDYGREMTKALASAGGRVSISGWASTEVFRRYLNAADLAVQLRTLSRGETSAAVLDAMNHALPVVANANGSMAYLPADAALVIDDEFSDEQLAHALETLWRDPARRCAMAKAGRRTIETRHSPADCAAAYAQAIESFAERARRESPTALVRRIGQVLPSKWAEPRLANIANAIAHNMPQPRPARQLVVDMTAWMIEGSEAPPFPQLVRDLVEHPVAGWRAEPVYQAPDGEWRYARKLLQREFACGEHVTADDPLDLRREDLWCVLSLDDAAHPSPPPDAAAHLGLESLVLPLEGDAAMTWACIAATARVSRGRQWFVDISELVRFDWRSGIQRAVKNYLVELLLHPPADATIVPVYAVRGEVGYRVAQDHVLAIAGLPACRRDRTIEPHAGDLFFCLDLQPHVVLMQQGYLEGLRRRGVRLAFMVYDLLPLQLPDCFGPGAAADHERWLRVVAHADMAICISQAVADDLANWFEQNLAAEERAPRLIANHLGADMTHAMATEGLPDDARDVLAIIRERPSFLMVGTLEPRKSHAAVVAAFQQLWDAGVDATLVIAGRTGWMVNELVSLLRSHPERGRRLIWLEDASDEFLEQVYAACACLIAASRGEGFGLPLVEAAQRGMPIIARDLHVFREVAGEHAFYFASDEPQQLADALRQWLALYQEGRHPASAGMPWLTWRQSAERLKRTLLELGTAQQAC
jgi:glycosyltransferase involved in cell wall biosynthesis